MHTHKVTCPCHSPRYLDFGALALVLTEMLLEEQDRTIQTASLCGQRLREPRLGSRGGEEKWGALSQLKSFSAVGEGSGGTLSLIPICPLRGVVGSVSLSPDPPSSPGATFNLPLTIKPCSRLPALTQSSHREDCS